MSYQIGTATDYADLLNKLDTFLTSQGMAGSLAFSGTGNGTISGLIGGSASVAESITITATDATHFSVTGSVSGAIGAATVGVAFASTKISFTITAGGTAFVAGDSFAVATAPPWTSKRRVAGSEMIWQAPGSDGASAIFVGAKTFSNTTGDYYNWRLGGFTAFDPALAFAQQAGYTGVGSGDETKAPVLKLWNSSIPYWFVANGRRVVVVAKVSTVYTMAYLGLIDSYMSPNAFPYPLFVGGSFGQNSEPAVGAVAWRWSATSTYDSNFPWSFLNTTAGSNPADGSARLRVSSGVWEGAHNYYADASAYNSIFSIWPTQGGTVGDVRANLDGSLLLLPMVLSEGSSSGNPPFNVWGELDGVLFTQGNGNAAENTITIGSSIYLVVPNIFRSTTTSYCAVKLI